LHLLIVRKLRNFIFGSNDIFVSLIWFLLQTAISFLYRITLFICVITTKYFKLNIRTSSSFSVWRLTIKISDTYAKQCCKYGLFPSPPHRELQFYRKESLRPLWYAVTAAIIKSEKKDTHCTFSGISGGPVFKH
jgi:hypothetical protein